MERSRENYRIEKYQDSAGEWRWRMVDKRNGKIVGASTEGYAREGACEGNLVTVTGWEADD